MKIWYVGLVLILVVGVLAGCGGEQATPAPADESAGETYTSASLDTSYDGALNASSQLVLGTLQLEETDYAVTPEQAASLLPLWQALQGGVTAEVEVNAVLKQIEGAMTQEQLEAIAAMQLTQENLSVWMREQGMGFGGQGRSPELQATRQAEFGGEGMPSDGEMPPEMATRRAEIENMSDEEREAMRATAQAGGGVPGGTGAGGRGGAGGRPGQFTILLNPLIELLTGRAAE